MLRTMSGLLRACHPEPTAAVTLLTLLLAVSSGRSAAGCVAVTAAVLSGQLSIGWANDWLDAARDRSAGRSEKPVAGGRVARSTVRTCALCALALVVPLSLLSGWRSTLAHAVAVALGWGYDLGLKATRASVLTYAGAFALLPAVVTLGLPGSPWPSWEVLVAGALLGAGAHLANALPDLAQDVRAGVHGLPQRLGPARTRVGSAGLLLAASVVLVLGPWLDGASSRAAGPSPGEVLDLLAAGAVVSLGLVLGRRPGSPAAFRCAMAVALLDVVLLVSSGSGRT